MNESHTCIYEKDITLALDHIKDIGIDTKKNREDIRGNGKPGLITRVALTEQSVKNIAALQWLNTTILVGAVVKAWFF